MVNNYNTNLNGPVILVSQEIKYTFPFSYAYLAGYLRQQGEDVRILFRPALGSLDRLVKEIMDAKPLLVGFGSLYPELKIISDLINKLNRAGRKFPIVIGGQMVSPIPEFAMKITGSDFGVIGEGEITLFKLVRALRNKKDTHGIAGLAIRKDDEIIFTGPGEFIEDLSKLPPIPYELFPEEKWVSIGRYYSDRAQPHWRFNDRVIPVHGGRGCPFNCNFCYHHSKFRFRPISDMIKDAQEQLKRFSGNMLYFGDDLVLSSPERARELTDALGNFKKPVEYSISTRFDVLDRIDDSLLREMKNTGCRIMGLGLESGSQRILDLMDKKITVGQIKNGLKRLKTAGILPTVSIMVGQLSETAEDVRESIELMRLSLEYDKNIEYAFTITTPFPGSPLYSLALEKGYIQDHADFYKRYKFNLFRRPFQLVINFSAMPDEELLSMYSHIGAVYKSNKKRILGVKVLLVENLRAFFYRSDFVLKRIILPVFPKFLRFVLLGEIYEFGYTFVQKRLDLLRLRLRGIDIRK